MERKAMTEIEVPVLEIAREYLDAAIEFFLERTKFFCAIHLAGWPAPGSEDTELGVLMELEVGHGETEVYPRVQA
jgi:hypothetical protein